ncbi:hypothetical protein TCAL_02219 [Tigriopus californicus]|uniref:C2H2-type domain-containing protein n=1 Tax=Tigriopus californicus TaxID=6832 RepID=A0A553P809_TIGCA|nr:hypothetical protein TCAL_02219 [Tigriopus californicus]
MAKVAKSRKGQLPSKSYVPTELDFAPDPVVLAESGLVCLDFGSWTWVTRNVLDFVKEKAWPLPSMTFLYNTQSGEFVSRVFNRLVESGQIFEGQVLQAKCQTFFQSDYPCLGMNYYESEEFPHHLKFATDCQKACGKAHLCAKKLWDHFEAEHHESEVWHVTCAICSETIDIKESRNSLRSHWASCISRNDGDHPDNPDSSMSIRTRKTTPLELYLPSSYLVEYEGQTFTLEGKVPRNQTWTCPLCSFQVKGADKAKHLKHHGKFRISCEICCLAHYCPLKLWDHWHDLHPEHTIWKGKCSVCLDVIDFKDSRTKLQDHFVSCFQASLEVGKDKPKPAPKIEPNSDAARPSRLIRRAQTFRGTTPKHLFHPPTFVVEWEGRDLVLPGYVGPEEAWVCPMCSTEMLGKQRMTHLRIHFFFRMGCEICRLFHLCPKKLWDHYKEKHTDQEIWQALCLVCAELVDIRESREAFRDHLLNCMRAPVMAKKEFGNVVTDPHPDKQVLSRVPQHLFVPNSFEVEWLGQTLTIPGKLSGKGKWTCPLCRETILTSRNCHLRKHNLIRIACGICGLFHMCSYKLWDHYNTLHSESEKWPCKCPVCSEVLDIKESRNKCRDHVVNCFVRTKREKYKANNLTNKSGTIIVCETCGKIFKNKRLMERHVLKIHQDKKLTSKCEVCAIELSDSKLRRHMRNVHLAARFECPMCFKVEKFARVFWEHLRDNHLDRVTEFPCPSCKQVFPINQDDGPNFPVHQEECLRQHLNQLKDAEKQRLLAKPLNYPCPICPKRFQTQYMANSHMRGHKEAGQFCNLCRYKTHSPAHLRAHINRVHGQNSNGMKCEFCNEKFKTQPSLEYHLSSAHGVKSEYPCDQCLLKLPTKVQLRKHQKNAHRGVDFKCSVCQSSFPDRESCENHTMASHYQAHARFQCTACQEVLKSKEELTHHMNTLHGYQLPVENHSTLPHTFSDTQPELVDLVGDARSHKLTPGYSDADPNLVRGHLRGHFMIYVQCGICQVPHYCPLKLWDHYQQQHQLEEEWKVKCSGCYEVHDIKPSRSTFRSHLLTCKRKSNQTKSSKPKKPWTRSPKVCDICGLTLQTDYHLRSHKSRVHENKVIIWQCHICDLEMNDNKKYSHLRKIHLHSRFSCTICNLRLRTGRSFLDHVLENHRGELESFKCPECKDDIPIESEEGPNFADHHEDCLRQHIKRLKDGVKQRTSSKPLKFPCPICAKRFPTQWLLNTHIRGHKDSGHFCSQCRYRTHSALHLRAHVARVHGESENGIKCEFCEDRFQTQDSIQEHLSRMHGIESEYQCQLCPLKTADKIQMRKHMKQCHPNYGPELKCDECHLVFQDQSSLDRHVFATHPSRTIRFQCNHCHHMFTKKEDLFLHMSDIHGLRPPMDELDQSHIQRLQPGIVDLTEPHTEMATFSTAVDPGLLFPVDNQAANMANPESMLLTLNGSQIHFS